MLVSEFKPMVNILVANKECFIVSCGAESYVYRRLFKYMTERCVERFQYMCVEDDVTGVPDHTFIVTKRNLLPIMKQSDPLEFGEVTFIKYDGRHFSNDTQAHFNHTANLGNTQYAH